MGSITFIKCVLTQEHLDAICAKYFVPEEVHPQLPSSDATMHERPTGKVGMYTRFFDYANYRILFSNFFVSVLTHFCISFSQLSVFGSAKNWNDHFFWVDEFVVPANARFGWFSGTNIVKDRAPTISEYNVEHANTLIAQASPFLRFPEEFLCWVGISRNYLLNKDTYPRFEYENGEEMDLNAFIRTADPRKVRIVERARTEDERPIVTVAKHRTVTLLPTSVPRPSGELSASIEREFVEDAGGSGGGDQEVASVGGHGNVEPIVPTTDNIVAETEASGPKRSKKKRVTRGSESTPTASHPPKRLRADYRTTGGSDAEALPLEEDVDHTDSVTGPSLRTVGPSARSVAPVMTTATTITAFVSNAATTTATLVDVGKDKDVPTPSIFVGSSSSDKTDRTLSLFTGRSGSDFVAGSIHAGGDANIDLQETYIPEWSVTKGFETEDLDVKDKEIEELRSQLLQAKNESMEVAQLRTRVSSLEAIEGSLQGEIASAKEHNGLLEQERNKEADQPITTEFNKDQGNECQDGSCNEQSIYNRKVINENTHTNITEIKEAMANNTINDGVEETKSSWPPGYTDNASYFNEFIANGNLVDIPMGGYKFTRVDKSCTKGSRLDRFLIADLTWNHLGPLTVLALDRTISDHPPNSPTPIHSTEFFKMADIPNRMQSSFITLIPKIESPQVVNDFRPISLIGILYKIIAKIISCRIALIIADIVDPVQFAFIKNRQILDGPMILNEVVHTLKRKKKKAMIFKVDITKAYDTLNEMFFTLHMEDAIEAKKYIGINIVIFGLFANSVMKTKLLRGWVATETELNHLPGVLGWLPTYYLSLFRMPRTVCNKLEAMQSKFFWGAEDTNRKIHWVKWDLVFASKDRKVFGFGSLRSLNNGFFYTNGGGDSTITIMLLSELHNTSMVPISVMKRKIGDGMSTLFWHDVWINDTPLAQQFPSAFLIGKSVKKAMDGGSLEWARVLLGD
ncbi:gypsy type transposase [Tanacetum coccineum]